MTERTAAELMAATVKSAYRRLRQAHPWVLDTPLSTVLLEVKHGGATARYRAPPTR